MALPDNQLSVRALLSRFGEKLLGRGFRAINEHRVGEPDWEPDGTHASILVTSEEDVYSVQVGFVDQTITTTCDCSRSKRCAHQAAALLKITRSPESAHNLRNALPWQVALGRGMNTPRPVNRAKPGQARLIYCIDTAADGQVIIETYKSQPQVKGGEKRTPFGVVRAWGADPLDPAPEFLSVEDVTLCRQLRPFPKQAPVRGQRAGAVHQFIPPAEVCYGLLLLLLGSGRLYLGDRPYPLTAGPSRVVVPEINTLDDGGWLLSLPLAGPTEAGEAPLADASGIQVFAGEPPLYCDGMRMGGLIVPLPGRLAARLAERPLRVPVEDRAEFVAHWLPRLTEQGDIKLPPELVPTPITDVAPVPRLSLADGDGELMVTLEFSYGEALPVSPSGLSKPMAEVDGALVAYQRDRGAERERLNRLSTPHTITLPPPTPRGPGHWSYSGDDALDFLVEELPALAADGWQIYGEASLAQHRVFRGRARIASRVVSGIDWFDLEVDADFGGTKLAAAKLLAALESGRRYVELPDGRVARVPDWIRARAEALHEAEMKDGQTRLSRFQIPLLMELTAGGDTAADTSFLESAERIHSFKGIGKVEAPKALKATLRPYQLEGLAWLEFLREYGFHGILADDMGLGKTIQVISLLLLEKQRGNLQHPSLVVVPTSLIFNWRHEIRKMAPTLKVAVWHGPGRYSGVDALEDADVILTNYALVRQDLELFGKKRFHYLVLDESQYIKNPESQISRAVRELKATHRLALTGTPLENHLGELWAQYAFLMPGLLGSYRHFRRRFGGPVERGDKEAAAALFARIRPFVLRRTKDQVASELPERVETTLYCRLEDEQRALYNKIRTQCRARVANAIKAKGLSRSRVTILDALLKLRQACCHPELLPAELAGEVTQSAKMTLFMEVITEAIEEEHRVLVFSQFVSMLSLIRRNLDAARVPYVYLDGRTRNREKRVAEFQENPAIPLFLISLKAGGTGLNLTGADYVIHFDPWWNPAVEQQATDRAHRIGQTRKVFSYKLIAEDTVEEKIVALQERKRALSNVLLGDGNEVTADLQLKDLEMIFGELG